MDKKMKYFIEIGSNNYDTLFNLCENGWMGVMVEPIKQVFDTLPTHKNLYLENVAITTESKQVEMYVVEKATDWSSLNPEHHKNIDSESEANKVIVNAITFNELAQKHGFPQIDFLKIDTEGHDAVIIKSIDFDKYKIKRVQFEYTHISENELIDVQIILTRAGFEFIGSDDANETWEVIT